MLAHSALVWPAPALHIFETLAKPKIEQCLAIVERTMAEAGLRKEQVSAVLLIGGMTRMPLLRP